MSVNPIIQAQFVDLYLGEGFADVKGLAGAGARRVEVPREWESHAQELLQICRQTLEELQDPEFAIVVDGVLLRVTLLEALSVAASSCCAGRAPNCGSSKRSAIRAKWFPH